MAKLFIMTRSMTKIHYSYSHTWLEPANAERKKEKKEEKHNKNIEIMNGKMEQKKN